MVKGKKREITELIEIFYEHLKENDEIYLSSFRSLEPDKRIYYPTNKNILDIIKAIQDKPYIYIKNPNEKNTLLKLSSHKRDPKTRYVQINDVLENARIRSERLMKMVETSSPEQAKMWVAQYQDFVGDLIREMERLRDRDKEYI